MKKTMISASLSVFAESYQEYFTTPYFVFIRDTLSYLALLGLHFALCLETSSIPFSGLEWTIMVFFLGRILMESRQFLGVKEHQMCTPVTAKKSKGSKREEKTKEKNRTGFTQICGEEEEEEKKEEGKNEKEATPTKVDIILHRCNKYFR